MVKCKKFGGLWSRDEFHTINSERNFRNGDLSDHNSGLITREFPLQNQK